MPEEIPLAELESDLANGLLEPLYVVLVAEEQRLYAKTVKGQADNPKRFKIVYAVVP